MLDEIKTFNYPYTVTIGFVSFLISTFIILAFHDFGLGFILIIDFVFLIGWLYFCIGSFIIIRYREEIESQKQIRKVIPFTAPLIMVIVVACIKLQHLNQIILFLNISAFLCITYSIVLIEAIKKQTSNKLSRLYSLLIVSGIAISFYFPLFLSSPVAKFLSILFGLFCLFAAAIFRAKEILNGDELERHIHLETLVYAYPFTILIILFLYLIHIYFKISINQGLIGLSPWIYFLLYSLIAKLIRLKYS